MRPLAKGPLIVSFGPRRELEQCRSFTLLSHIDDLRHGGAFIENLSQLSAMALASAFADVGVVVKGGLVAGFKKSPL
jgi:hypothetical protein